MNPTAPVVAKAAAHCPFVLLVEPDTHLREKLSAELRTAGDEILGLRDGPALLEYFQMAAYGLDVIPDVIVGDVHQPEARILDACAQLHHAGTRVPIVLLSRAAARAEAYERGGASLVLHDPIDLHLLQVAIDELVEFRAAAANGGDGADFEIEVTDAIDEDALEARELETWEAEGGHTARASVQALGPKARRSRMNSPPKQAPKNMDDGFDADVDVDESGHEIGGGD